MLSGLPTLKAWSFAMCWKSFDLNKHNLMNEIDWAFYPVKLLITNSGIRNKTEWKLLEIPVWEGGLGSWWNRLDLQGGLSSWKKIISSAWEKQCLFLEKPNKIGRLWQTKEKFSKTLRKREHLPIPMEHDFAEKTFTWEFIILSF